jgi:hypothetical protein
MTTLVLFSSIGLSVFDKHQSKAGADTPPTNAQLKSLYSEKCSACHDLPDPEAKGFTKQQWQSTVNRMLDAHGARTSISEIQAAQIVTYLSEFAPKPNAPGAASNNIGVWQYDPVVSVAYPFTYAPNINSFEIRGGTWKVVQNPVSAEGYLKSAAAGTAVLMENKHTFVGAIDIQTQFHINQSGSNAAVGLVFGAEDAGNYLAAEYCPSTQTVSLLKITGGQSTVIEQTKVDEKTPSSESWHSLRVKVTEDGSAAEVLLDYQRQIKTAIPGWKSGKAGLISTGPLIAGYRQLTIDSYQGTVRQPSGDVLLH